MTSTQPATAFYVSASPSHYPGLVALVNSLRLVGHDEPVYVADCGLHEKQRRRLGAQVTLVPVDGAPTPHLAKTIAPLTHPADVQVLLDADVVVTRSLAPLVDRARAGRIVAFADHVWHRFDEAWATLLDLGQLHRHPYVNSGILVTERAFGAALLQQVASAREQVDVDRTFIANGSPDYPFYYLDQDILNAYLGTVPADRMRVLEHRLSPFPPFTGVRLLDERTLRCAYADGVEPFALHHIARKPWLERTRWSVYSRLFSRLLLADDVPIRLEPGELPLRLRPGRLAWLEKRRSDAVASLVSQRGRLGVRRRLRGRTARN